MWVAFFQGCQRYRCGQGIWNSIRGVDNLDLQDKYSTGIRTLLGVHSRGFPNLFIMGGES